ncbi:hypothetical protein STCU_11099 [Strigomonas culicis]|uniref:Uncharacterized protein n=1 Tax=Strigomonas culicis TaxID=28005 RepID=S9TF18_9TRYP|nr:hypothetical protein STCU_11099 [Strigomonas culicis]|eukprot:EPY16627.1 hypothetical protein STCU_11099 [Strigomonas culicis]
MLAAAADFGLLYPAASADAGSGRLLSYYALVSYLTRAAEAEGEPEAAPGASSPASHTRLLLPQPCLTASQSSAAGVDCFYLPLVAAVVRGEHLDVLAALTPALLSGYAATCGGEAPCPEDAGDLPRPLVWGQYSSHTYFLHLAVLFTAVEMQNEETVLALLHQVRDGRQRHHRPQQAPLREAALHALALIALRRRSILPLASVATINSPDAAVVERFLRNYEAPEGASAGGPPPAGPQEALSLLVLFYITMQRYADAYAVGQRMAADYAAHGTTGGDGLVANQRLQIVLSYLKGFAPQHNTQYMLQGAAPTQNSAWQQQQQQREKAAAAALETYPTVLERHSAVELATQTSVVLGRLQHRLQQVGGGGTLYAGGEDGADRSDADREMQRRLLQPSTLVASLAPLGSSAASSAQSHRAPPASSGPARPQAVAARAAAAATFAARGGDGAEYCECITKRSGRVCGLPLPCRYHSH